MLGTSVALHVSDIPFNGPSPVCASADRDEWVINPTQTELRKAMPIFFFRAAAMRSSWSRAARKPCLRTRFSKRCIPAHEAIQPLLDIQEEIRRGYRQGQTASPLGRTRPCGGCAASRNWRWQQTQRGDRDSRKNWTATSELPKSKAKSYRKRCGVSRQEKEIKGAFEELTRKVFRRSGRSAGAADRWPRAERHTPDHVRG